MSQKEFYRGFEVCSKNRLGKYYLDKPGQYWAPEVDLVLYEKVQKNGKRAIYLLGLETVVSCTKYTYLRDVPDTQFKETVQKLTGVPADEIVLTKAAAKITEKGKAKISREAIEKMANDDKAFSKFLSECDDHY